MKLSVHVSIDGVAVTDHQRCLRVSWLLWTVLTPSSVLNTTQSRAAGVSASVKTTNTGETPHSSLHSTTPPYLATSILWVVDNGYNNSNTMINVKWILVKRPGSSNFAISDEIRTSAVFWIIDVFQCDCSDSVVINVCYVWWLNIVLEVVGICIIKNKKFILCFP